MNSRTDQLPSSSLPYVAKAPSIAERTFASKSEDRILAKIATRDQNVVNFSTCARAKLALIIFKQEIWSIETAVSP